MLRFSNFERSQASPMATLESVFREACWMSLALFIGTAGAAKLLGQSYSYPAAAGYSEPIPHESNVIYSQPIYSQPIYNEVHSAVYNEVPTVVSGGHQIIHGVTSGSIGAGPAIIPNSTASGIVISNSVSQASYSSAGLATASMDASAILASSEDWKASIDRARGNLSAATLPDQEKAKVTLYQAIERLENFVGVGTTFGQNWLSFLKIQELRELLQTPKPDLASLIDFEMRFRQNYPGLERKAVTDVRDAIVGLIRAVRFGADPEATFKVLNESLEKLDSILSEKGFSDDLEQTRTIGLALGYLHDSGQAADLVRQVTSRYSRPNLNVLVSQGFLSRRFSRPIAQPSPVNEVILGTCINGTSCLLGTVTPQLVNNSRGATIELVLRGSLSSNNVGTNRGVTILSRGNASVLAAVPVTLTETGVSTGATRVDSQLSTTIDSIQHPRRIVQKIATKKAAQSKSQANAIATERLETRLSQRYGQEVQERIAEAQGTLSGGDRPVLDRLGLVRPIRNTSTTSDMLNLNWLHRTPYQLAAAQSPSLPISSDGISIQVHQSLIMNAADVILGGRTIRSSQLKELAKQFLGEVPEELKNQSEEEPWSVTLALFHPVEVEAKDDRVSFTVRVTQLTRGDNPLNQAASIKATYQLKVIDGKPRLVRDGDVAVDFTGRAQRGTRAVTLRAFLKTKFDEVFKDTLLDRPIDLSSRFPALPRDLSISSLRSANGWLQISIY